jgi:hypothetical protein
MLYENEFQNPQIFQQTISLFPEQSTLPAMPFNTIRMRVVFNFMHNLYMTGFLVQHSCIGLIWHCMEIPAQVDWPKYFMHSSL